MYDLTFVHSHYSKIKKTMATADMLPKSHASARIIRYGNGYATHVSISS